MADPILALDSDRVLVEPGGQATVSINITNPNTIVEGYRITVVGDGVTAWAQALSPDVSVYPKHDATVSVVFSPPGGPAAPGGTWPFGILVSSTEDADASAVVEGDLEIGKIFGLQAKLLPVNSSGRWRGHHVVHLSNWGNTPVRLSLSASDPDDSLAFLIRPDVVDLPLGGTATAHVVVRTKRPFLRGPSVRIPFTVTGAQEGVARTAGLPSPNGPTLDRPRVDGALNQMPIINRGAVAVATAAAVALAGGLVWALTRPGPAAPTFQELGLPEQPKRVVAKAVGVDTVRLNWEAVDNVQSYVVAQVVDGKRLNSQPVPGEDTAKDLGGLTPGARVCFQVQAVRGALAGPHSIPACTMTLKGTGSTTPVTTESTTSASTAPSSGAGTTTPTSTTSTGTRGDPGFKGKYFVADFWPVELTTIDGESRVNALRKLGVPAGLVTSDDYPNSSLSFVTPSVILYVGPFDSAVEANSKCTALRKVSAGCQPLQLDP